MQLDLDSANNDMLTLYQREKSILPYERIAVPFVDGMKSDETGMKLLGNELRFPIRIHDGYGIGRPNDRGDWSQPRQHAARQGIVTRAQLDAALEISFEAAHAGEGPGSFTGDPVEDGVKNCLRVYMYQKNILFLGHGTGRVAVVAADVAAADTVVMDAPEFALALRIGCFYEFTDLDSGGTVQDLGGGSLEAQVTDINLLTHTVTWDRDITVSAGWSIYVAGTYGRRAPNGLRGIIDNGDLTDTIFGLDRADNPRLDALILDNGGALQDYSEDLVRSAFVQTQQRAGKGMVPTEFWSNGGVISEHYRHTTPDRTFQVNVGDGVPTYQIGANQDLLAFHWGGRRVPFKEDNDLPARSLYGSYKPGWRKHIFIEDDWLKQAGALGKGFLDWAPASGGVTKSNRLIGSLQGNSNCSHRHLNAQFAILNIRDRDTARD